MRFLCCIKGLCKVVPRTSFDPRLPISCFRKEPADSARTVRIPDEQYSAVLITKLPEKENHMH